MIGYTCVSYAIPFGSFSQESAGILSESKNIGEWSLILGYTQGEILARIKIILRAIDKSPNKLFFNNFFFRLLIENYKFKYYSDIIMYSVRIGIITVRGRSWV